MYNSDYSESRQRKNSRTPDHHDKLEYVKLYRERSQSVSSDDTASYHRYPLQHATKKNTDNATFVSKDNPTTKLRFRVTQKVAGDIEQGESSGLQALNKNKRPNAIRRRINDSNRITIVRSIDEGKKPLFARSSDGSEHSYQPTVHLETKNKSKSNRGKERKNSSSSSDGTTEDDKKRSRRSQSNDYRKERIPRQSPRRSNARVNEKHRSTSVGHTSRRRYSTDRYRRSESVDDRKKHSVSRSVNNRQKQRNRSPDHRSKRSRSREEGRSKRSRTPKLPSSYVPYFLDEKREAERVKRKYGIDIEPKSTKKHSRSPSRDRDSNRNRSRRRSTRRSRSRSRTHSRSRSRSRNRSSRRNRDYPMHGIPPYPVAYYPPPFPYAAPPYMQYDPMYRPPPPIHHFPPYFPPRPPPYPPHMIRPPYIRQRPPNMMGPRRPFYPHSNRNVRPN